MFEQMANKRMSVKAEFSPLCLSAFESFEKKTSQQFLLMSFSNLNSHSFEVVVKNSNHFYSFYDRTTIEFQRMEF